MLQSRKSKREEPLDFHVRDPILGRADILADPERLRTIALSFLDREQ